MPSTAPQPSESAPSPQLVVVEPFPGHVRGDLITDANEAAMVLAGAWAAHVVQRAAA